MRELTEHIVPVGVPDMPLSRYIARAWPLMPGRVARETLKKRDVRVNGAHTGAEGVVRGGDRLTLYVEDRYLNGRLDVLFDDGRLLVVEKPAGLPVDVDAQGIGADTVLTRVQRIHPQAELCHRLDAGTGGVLLLALDGSTRAALDDAFKNHKLTKKYQCVTRGHPTQESGALTHYLLKDARASRVRAYASPHPGAKKAELRYHVLTRSLDGCAELALMEIELLTGRTHQIRAQMSAVGHPLLGDDVYGDRALNRRRGAATPLLWCVEMRLTGEGLLARYRDRAFVSPPQFRIKDGNIQP